MLSKLYTASVKVFEPHTVDDTYQVVVDEAVKLVDAKFASIFVWEEKSFKRIGFSSTDLLPVVPRKNGYTYKVLTTKKAHLLPGEEITKHHPNFAALGVGSDISVPLYMEDIPLGVLSVLSPKERLFTEKELEAIRLYATFASAALFKNQLNDQLRASLQARDLFASIAAHELKTPLTTIDIYTQLISKKIQTGNIPPLSHVQTIERETARMGKMLNELLAANSSNQKLRFDMRERSFISIVNRCVKDFTHTYPQLRVQYKESLNIEAPKVIGDADKLQQAFTNILNNAAKFSGDGSVVTVQISNTVRSVSITITDRGPGIPEDLLPHIFKKYYSGPNHSKKGMGLGLYLVEQIMKAHRGSIHVKTKLNKGTTFRLKLPLYV